MRQFAYNKYRINFPAAQQKMRAKQAKMENKWNNAQNYEKKLGTRAQSQAGGFVL
jgi:hypothetical protein